MWVARDKDGTLVLYAKKPNRLENDQQWHAENSVRYMYLEEDMFPNLKWEGEALKVDLVTKP